MEEEEKEANFKQTLWFLACSCLPASPPLATISKAECSFQKTCLGHTPAEVYSP